MNPGPADALWEQLLAHAADRIAQLIEERVGSSPRARWMTVGAASEHLGLSTNSIRALVKRKRIPFYKVEGRILFDQQELDDWIRAGARRT